MRFSVWPNPRQSFDDVLELARHAERTGWDGVWFADHFMPDGEDTSGPTLECWGVLGALARETERVRIGSLVCGNTYRHPAVLAKTASTVDIASGGRLVLGIGAGWQENEHRAYGIEFFTTSVRLDRLAEACEVIRSLIHNPRTTFEGRHYRLVDAPLEPKPTGPLPLLVGGGGERRTLRITARFADEWNVWATPEVLAAKSEVLARHCEDVGRDPATIARSTQALVFFTDTDADADRLAEQIPMPVLAGTTQRIIDTVGRYRDAGADELIVPDFTLGTGPGRLEAYDRFAEEVIPAFR